MADSVYFEFEDVEKARAAVQAAADRNLSATLEETDGAARVHLPPAEVLDGEVLLMRHGGHAVHGEADDQESRA